MITVCLLLIMFIAYVQ